MMMVMFSFWRNHVYNCWSVILHPSGQTCGRPHTSAGVKGCAREHARRTSSLFPPVHSGDVARDLHLLRLGGRPVVLLLHRFLCFRGLLHLLRLHLIRGFLHRHRLDRLRERHRGLQG